MSLQPTRHATTRECTTVGTRCWITGDVNYPPPRHLNLRENTPAIIAAVAPRACYWVQIPSGTCVHMDRSGLAFSHEYRTRRGKWLPEWHPRVRLYLQFKLEEARAEQAEGVMSTSRRYDTIAHYKFLLRRNGWYAEDLPGDTYGTD